MRITAILLIAFGLLNCHIFIFAQESEDFEQTQTQPAKKYEISQKFEAGSSFEKHLKQKITIANQYSETSLEMISNVEISIIKAENGKAKYAKVKFLKTEISTENKSLREKMNINLKNHWFEGSVDDDFFVKPDKKSPEFPDEGDLFIKDFKIIKFAYPKDSIIIGDTWEGSKTCAGSVVYQVPGDYKVKFKLDKTTKNKENIESIANIKSNVDFTMKKASQIRKIKGAGEYNFDLLNNRLISSTTSDEVTVKIKEGNQEYETKTSSTTSVEYKYKSEFKMVEEVPIEPKNEESE